MDLLLSEALERLPVPALRALRGGARRLRVRREAQRVRPYVDY